MASGEWGNEKGETMNLKNVGTVLAVLCAASPMICEADIQEALFSPDPYDEKEPWSADIFDQNAATGCPGIVTYHNQSPETAVLTLASIVAAIATAGLYQKKQRHNPKS